MYAKSGTMVKEWLKVILSLPYNTNVLLFFNMYKIISQKIH